MFHLIEGNVGKAELRYSKDGKPVYNFTVAVSNDYYDRDEKKWIKKDPTWWAFGVWDDAAERLAERVGTENAKGKRVAVEFKSVTLRTWEGNDGRFGAGIQGGNIQKVLEIVKPVKSEATDGDTVQTPDGPATVVNAKSVDDIPW